MKKMTFALCFCNRGFMPGELIYGAREDMIKAVTDAGYDYIAMDAELTRYGGVETRDEGLLYAKWLKEHEGQYDGVIFSMPIFADENGAITALQDAGVPILMQAYPDEIGKMDFAHRRDAYCGKFSVTDVFTQYEVPFTVMKPHVVHPLSEAFAQNLKDFAAVCRVVNGMKRFNVGCLGARTTAFKTVRFDEITLQKYGINVESFDLSEVFAKVNEKADDDGKVLAKIESLKNYTDFSRVPESNMSTLAKVGVVIDEYTEEYHLDALTLRCWNEMETYLRVCPCVLLSELNDRGIVASCEIDMCSALTMRAMNLASEQPTAVLDWNNNYGDDENKVILFHCGPVAQGLMAGKGTVTEHKMFAKNDPGSGWGCNEGRIKAFPTTISNCQTKDGKIIVYASEAEFTEDPIEEAFFGCGGVCQIPDLQNKLIRLARGGFKHHTSVGVGHMKEILKEAFTTYLEELPGNLEASVSQFDRERLNEALADPKTAATIPYVVKSIAKLDDSAFLEFMAGNRELIGHCGEDVYLQYWGIHCSCWCDLALPQDKKYDVEVIDVWEMTRERKLEAVSGLVHVPLPGKEGIAVLAKRIG